MSIILCFILLRRCYSVMFGKGKINLGQLDSALLPENKLFLKSDLMHFMEE